MEDFSYFLGIAQCALLMIISLAAVTAMNYCYSHQGLTVILLLYLLSVLLILSSPLLIGTTNNGFNL